MNPAQELRIIAFRDGDIWVAQCLEHDIGTQAKNLNDLWAQLDLTIRAEIQDSMERDVEPFAGIGPAPTYFQKMWDTRSGSFKPVRPMEARVDGGVYYDVALSA